MIEIVKMNDDEYEAYREKEIKFYAQMKIKTEKWEPKNSYFRAEQEISRFLPKSLSDSDTSFLKIIDQKTGNHVGIVCYGPTPNRSTTGCYIYDIRIFDEYQRKGYGQMVFTKLEEEFRKKGIKKIILDVDIHNKTAFSFYQKMGYNITYYRMEKAL